MVSSVAVTTYNRSRDALQEPVCNLVRKRADLCQSTQRHLLPLRWLLELGGELLGEAQLCLKGGTWIELSHSNLANRAVTDESSEAKNISYDRLIMSFSEHKGDKFPHSVEQHHDMSGSLSLVSEGTVIRFD